MNKARGPPRLLLQSQAEPEQNSLEQTYLLRRPNMATDRYYTDPSYRKAVDSYKAAQKIARDWLATGFSDNPNDNVELRNALIKIIGRGKSYTPRDEIVEMLRKGPVDDITLFKKYKYGLAEMRAIIRYMIKEVATKDRLWIAYDEDEEQYYIFGEGEDVPEKWTGYLPKDD